MPTEQGKRDLNLFVVLYLILTVSVCTFRVIIFAANYAGMELDDGWHLGVAKNLADRGLYASYTNGVMEEGAGAYPSVNARFDIQDEKGFVYFPLVGPGYVLPEAILLKIFGDGWWRYRLWPLTAYAGLLFCLFYIVWTIGGFLSLLILQTWLWATPQLTTTFAYTAYAEHIGLFYILLSFLIYLKATESRQKSWYGFLAGLFLALAIQTKPIYALTVAAFALVIVWELYRTRGKSKSDWLRWSMFAVGFLLPLILFELYRYTELVSRFDIETWKANNERIKFKFIHINSGIETLGKLNWSFIKEKLCVWSVAAIEPCSIAWVAFLLSPLPLLRRIQKRYWILVCLMYLTAAITFFWHVLISPTGWARYTWHGLILAMTLISIGVGITVQARYKEFRKENIILILLIIAIIGVSVNYDKIEMRPYLDELTIAKWNILRNGGKGLPHTPIISLVHQREFIKFFEENIAAEDRIYYLGVFHVAEMSTLLDKVFYPLARHFKNNGKNPNGGASYVILGPYEQGPWSMVPPSVVTATINKYCDSAVFANKSYSLWTIKENIE